MTSLLLDGADWDLCVDRNGDLALCTSPYDVAQDVACALRTFQGECWYDTGRGLPYFSKLLGRSHNEASFIALAEEVAATVPGVESARCIAALNRSDRRLHGTIELTLRNGETTRVAF